jgi:carboxymethylenebutenolidase
MSSRLPEPGRPLVTDDIVIETDDGEMGVHIVHRAEAGTSPVVLFLMDAPGKRPLLHRMAAVIAGHGYYVMLPNLYYRDTEAFELDFSSRESFERMSELMYRVSNRNVVADARALTRYAAADPAADASAVGVVGYCMSGPFSIHLAAEMADVVTCAASFYGVRLVVDRDESPHRGLPAITGEIYVAAAEFDDYVPLTMIDEFEAARASAGTRGRVEVYWGTHHGFAFDDRPAYDAVADDRHWHELLGLFARNLGGTPPASTVFEPGEPETGGIA